MHKLIGDRKFYRYVIGIVTPMIIQQGITNFVSLLDNIMVGQVGTLPMSGVAIANQFIFIFNLCVFGAVAGAGIFTAQFHGSQNQDGIRYTFRFKFLICLVIAFIGIAAFTLFGDKLITLYLRAEQNNPEDAAASMQYGLGYLKIMVIGLIPFALTNIYSGTLRETEKTFIPMVGGITAVLVNLVLNYVLIFGHFGAPQMGVKGAALATVVSRFVELCIVAGWVHTHTKECPFIVGAYRSMYIPVNLFFMIVKKGLPLLVNEALWSSGMAIMAQCYSVRGLDVVAAQNISSTIYNLCSVVYMSMGSAVGIIIGRLLGEGRSEEIVRDYNRKLSALAIFSCVIFGGILVSISGVFPQIYNTTDEIKNLATKLIWVTAFMMPIHSYNNATYFTLRSGGQTFITFLFDSCFIWVCCIPLGYCLSHFTAMPIVPLYACCQGIEIVKVIIGYYMIRQGKWIQNLVAE